MLLIIEILLFFIVLYRGWVLESIGLFFLFFLEQILIVELNITDERVDLGVEILFILILLIFCIYKKKDYSKICKNCNSSLGESRYSCDICGYPLVKEVYKEIKAEASYIIRMILKDKESFQEVKEIIFKQYQELGLENIVIDKKNTFMLKSENNSYILVKKKNFDLTIETFNISKPNFDNHENLFILNHKKR